MFWIQPSKGRFTRLPDVAFGVDNNRIRKYKIKPRYAGYPK